MTRARVALLLLLVAIAGCATSRTARPSNDTSGFLDDYSLLREGGPGELTLVYRNPDANWRAYDKVMFEPVTLWRSGRKSLTAVPDKDLLRLVSTFEGAVRARVAKGFTVVTSPGPGVMRIRLAITNARASDTVLDVLNARGSDGTMGGDGPLDPELARFLEGAEIEGEIRDAVSDEVLAQGVDRRRREGALPLSTWGDVERAAAFWSDRTCARLEARTGRR